MSVLRRNQLSARPVALAIALLQDRLSLQRLDLVLQLLVVVISAANVPVFFCTRAPLEIVLHVVLGIVDLVVRHVEVAGHLRIMRARFLNDWLSERVLLLESLEVIEGH